MKKLLAMALLVALCGGAALADDRLRPNTSINELTDLAGASVADSDFMLVYDASANDWLKTSLEGFAEVTASINGLTASATELNYNDITTLGTLAASKAWTSDASLDTIMPTGGLLTVQSGGQITMNSGSTLAVSGTFTGATLSLTGDLSGDGGDQLFGFLQDQVASTTTSATIAQCGKTFVSNSADVLTLPEASTALGCRYTFVCGTADDFDINPADGTDQILSVSTTNGTTGVVTLAPAAGDAIRCTDIGGSITLEATGADAWAQVAGGNGIWTDVN